MTVEDINQFKDATPPLKKGSSKMFRTLRDKGKAGIDIFFSKKKNKLSSMLFTVEIRLKTLKLNCFLQALFHTRNIYFYYRY